MDEVGPGLLPVLPCFSSRLTGALPQRGSVGQEANPEYQPEPEAVLGFRTPISSSRMARPIEKQPPIRNEAMAAIRAQRKLIRPWPRGCRGSAGLRDPVSASQRKTSLIESAAEWPASASIAADPEASPAITFATVTTMFARSAIRMLRAFPFRAALLRAAREWRWCSWSRMRELADRCGLPGSPALRNDLPILRPVRRPARRATLPGRNHRQQDVRGVVASWKMRLVAMRGWSSSPIGSPVLRLRSKRGKLLY